MLLCTFIVSSIAFIPTLVLDAGVVCSRVVREAQLIFQAIEKEGLPGRKDDKSWVGRHRLIHAPGIQQEPGLFVTMG